MKQGTLQSLVVTLCALACLTANTRAQVNSGSNGSDGALDLTAYEGSSTNIVIDMADHPAGIYHYTAVTIPIGVTVSFLPNANNTPVYWLVQSNVLINGTVDVSGKPAGGIGGAGGPGGWAGGSGGGNPSPGQGPGGGGAALTNCTELLFGGGGGGSFGSQGGGGGCSVPAGQIYGNSFLVPLLGGSGAGGASAGGGGGGGAILIAASGFIELNGGISADGGVGVFYYPYGTMGGGSGGGVRLVTSIFRGAGVIYARGAGGGYFSFPDFGGLGRVRIDAIQSIFSGYIYGVSFQGSQFIIFPTSGQGAQLSVTSVGGVPVSASPTGQIATPDAVLSAQQGNPVPIVVQCQNIPLNSLITVTVKPANGSAVSGTGHNTTGSAASSTATVNVNMPRGGGLIYATAATGN